MTVHRTRRRDPRLPAVSEVRALAVKIGCDPRSIERELLAPGSVTGMAGNRVRAALAELGFEVYRRPGPPLGLSRAAAALARGPR